MRPLNDVKLLVDSVFVFDESTKIPEPPTDVINMVMLLFEILLELLDDIRRTPSPLLPEVVILLYIILLFNIPEANIPRAKFILEFSCTIFEFLIVMLSYPSVLFTAYPIALCE